MSKLFTSDLHIGHSRIVEFTDRGKFVTQDEHDQWIIQTWNSQVSPNDVVYHLGDFCFYKSIEQIMELLDVLNGKKVFLKGNHDSSKTFKKFINHPSVISTERMIEEIMHEFDERQPVSLLHYPMAVWRNSHYGAYHLHGHSHGSYWTPKNKILDVGLDNAIKLYNKPKFFTVDDINDYMSYREMQSVDHHKQRETKND